MIKNLLSDDEPESQTEVQPSRFPRSSSSVQTLFEHDPAYKQNGTLIGAFGPTTSKAVEDLGLSLDVKAPAPNAPSMVSALEHYLTGSKK